jgi:hypothetical protein
MAVSTPTRIEGDLFVNGNISGRTMSVAASAISDAQVAGSANIAATKLQHQHRPGYSQPNTTATTVTQAIFRCFGLTGAVVGFHAGSIGINAGAATITVDLKKNGASILTGVITLNSANVARVAVAGVISGGTLAAGDLLEVVVTATAGGGTIGTGFFCFATVNEDAQ